MAKQNNTTAPRPFSIVVSIANIIWFRDLNRARPTGDYGKSDELRDSLVKHGWLMDDNGTLYVEKLPAMHAERANRERQERYDALKTLAKSDTSKLADLAAFEEIYTDGKGKPLPVEYLGVTGNRRSEAYFPAMVERKKQNLAITTEVPAIVRVYASALERLTDQIGENQFKTLGFKPTTDVDNLIAAKEAVDMGAIQSDLRKTFKDGVGQKMWGVIMLDRRFPDLSIISRMQRKPDAEGYIALSGVKFSDMPTLVMRSDPKALAEKNQQLFVSGKDQLKPLTQQDAADYFNGTVVPKGNEKKVMKGENIRGMADGFPALPLRAVAKAIAENNTDLLKPYQVATLGFNALESLIASNDYPPVELILTKILTAPDRQQLLAKLIEVCE